MTMSPSCHSWVKFLKKMTQFMGCGGKGPSFPRLCVLVRRWLSFQWEIRQSEIQDKRPQSFYFPKAQDITPPHKSESRRWTYKKKQMPKYTVIREYQQRTWKLDRTWVGSSRSSQSKSGSSQAGFDCMGHLHPLPLTPIWSGSSDFSWQTVLCPMSALCGLTHEI